LRTLDMTRFGVVFPQVEIEPDPASIRRYVEGVEKLGFDHLLVYDHVVGVDPAVQTEFASMARSGGATSAKPYDVGDSFHEVMVLLGFLAGLSTLELVTGVLVLPQRQTALVAKQAAEVDLLCGGRFRLGVGIGWNQLEFRSMGREFRDRGRRIDRQIELLRLFWTETTVRHQTDEDWAMGVGILPRPVQQPIPIWIGAGATPRALQRVGRLGDGWLPVGTDPVALGAQLETIRDAARAAGRDSAAIGIQGRLETVAARSRDEVTDEVARWKSLGATHLALNTMRCGLVGADQHLDALSKFRDPSGLVA
jgi:probable F420-dependent oxidoreductase